MRRFLKIVLAVLIPASVIIISTTSCTHDPQGLAGLDTVCFETQILPLISNTCGVSGCHGGSSGRSELVLTDYQGIRAEVTPGKASSSRLYQAITTVWLGNLMPPNGPLSMEDRTLVKVWIEQGAKETKCPSATK